MRNEQPSVVQGAEAILGAFDRYHTKFKEITRRAKYRFESQDWHAAQKDAVERLELYGHAIQEIILGIQDLLGESTHDPICWEKMKAIYSSRIAGRNDFELAETFFNSLTRRIFSTAGVAPHIEFVDSDFETPSSLAEKPIIRTYPCKGKASDVLKAVLSDSGFGIENEDQEQDLCLVGREIDFYLQSTWGEAPVEAVEMLMTVFYRGQGAYLVGRVIQGEIVIPLVIVLRHHQDQLRIDAVLLTENETSILFSFTRSYFHVEAEIPYKLISFLKSLLPHKRVAELYISIGYNKHGKTELYRDLLRHLDNSTDKFVIAPGEKGMVMLVFSLPSYDMVFKVIRDRFAEPKSTTRKDVMERYQLVFKHDRAGRLVDAQEFEHLKFDRRRFSEDLIQELQTNTESSVLLSEESITIKHLYMERRTIPLDVFVREGSFEVVREVVIDYGQAIKDLAATNIFPGDILLKNFGVTRHGRVVFYDYDELTLLTECNFRVMPTARDDSDDYEADPWFFVGKNDIFPEEFKTFLGLPDKCRETFFQAHEDLLGVKFWKGMQKRHRAGEVLEIYPYKQHRLLRMDHTPGSLQGCG